MHLLCCSIKFPLIWYTVDQLERMKGDIVELFLSVETTDKSLMVPTEAELQPFKSIDFSELRRVYLC